jgi:anti-sigma28 factor (negative regulator of flagellin synthesis)
MKIDGKQLGGVDPEPNVPKTGPGSNGPGQTGGAEATRRAARLGYEKTSEAAEAGATAAADEVTLSDLGRELSRLTNADAGREARVEQLAADYSAGRLNEDAGKTAVKIIDDAFHSE